MKKKERIKILIYNKKKNNDTFIALTPIQFVKQSA